MSSQVLKLNRNKFLVNLFNVHDGPRVLNEGRTLGLLQPTGSVSPVPRDEASHSTQSQSSPLLILDDVLDFRQAMLEGAELTTEQVSECCELILEDTGRFVGHDGWTGQTDWPEHGIDEQGSTPLKRTYQRVLNPQKVVDEQLDKVLQQGITEPSNSHWAYTTVLVTKKYGSIRFSVDFRLLNSLSKKMHILCLVQRKHWTH